ncbi:MAG: hypothetical protein E7H05_02110 [Veillonella sp.]|uniref:hypothetical protein n=1 Tax=Veillonella sp. TaxID=1926307 RepID=UPI00290951EE|nr:hypothetical protein [Veillonella sp.]MDU3930258.1 hypothetical protein [Veillonella sp.]MDU7211731.1 hypothetical protein [Veillonella sp.]
MNGHTCTNRKMEQRRTQNLSTAHSQAGRAGGTMASLPRMIPVLAAMLIPTMAVFYIIKTPLLKRETKKLVEKKLAATPSTDDVLTSVYWEFSNQEYMSNDAFTLDIINYIEDNKANWNPNGIAINSRKYASFRWRNFNISAYDRFIKCIL